MLTVLLQVGFGTLDMVALERDLLDHRLEIRNRQGVQVAPSSSRLYCTSTVCLSLYIYKNSVVLFSSQRGYL
jgi:hypothetical protein